MMRLRLTVITSLLALLAVLVMGFHSAFRERRLLLQESLHAKSQALVTALMQPCLEALTDPEHPDHGQLDHYLAALTDQEALDVVEAVIIDDSGRIVAHTDPEQYGRQATDPFLLEAMNATQYTSRTYRDAVYGEVLESAQPLAIEQLRWGTLDVKLSMERVKAQLRAGYARSIAWAFLVIGPLAATLYYHFSRTLVHPVLALAQGVRRASRGDLSTPVEIRPSPWHRDELRLLVRGFNEMLEGLREREWLKGELEVARKLEQAHKELTQVHEALKEAQSQLIQAEKMAALGELVAGVAHELNNPVNYLVQSIVLLRERLEAIQPLLQKEPAREDGGHASDGETSFDNDDEDTVEELNTILNIMTDGAERTATIVRKLRDFSRMERPNTMTPVALAPVLDACLELLHFEIKNRIDVVKEYAAVDAVEGDPSQFDQLFLNLLSNAVQAIPARGQIRIRIFQENEKVCVAITDTGTGIKPEHMRKLFDPFFTTKEVGKGTGLGLSLCYRVVQRLNGDILVQSQEGQGATFTVKLPRAALATTPNEMQDPGLQSGSGGE